MAPPDSGPRFPLRALVAGLGLLLLIAAAIGASRPGGPVGEWCTPAGVISEADMAASVGAYFAAHPAHGNAVTDAAADTFLATGLRFDADHSVFTATDTVHIATGQSIMFKWVSGSHTTTSGVPGDPTDGSLWDYPLNSSHPEVTIAFPNPGVFPFECRPHALSGMLGVIIVEAATPTRVNTWGAVKARYR